jgi:hypothetical protein
LNFNFLIGDPMTTRKAIRCLATALLAFHVALIVPTVVIAQEAPVQGAVPTTASTVRKVGEGNQYYLGQANELLIRVNIWGKVTRPGQYFVPASTDLITLISVAGGPIARSRLTDIRVVRTNEKGESEVILVNVKKFLKTGDKRLIPDLRPEDTVVVHGSVWQLIGDVTQVIGSLGSAAIVYFYLFRAK